MQKTKDSVEFNRWREEAIASGKPFRVGIDCSTQEFHVEYLTQAEIDAGAAVKIIDQADAAALAQKKQIAIEKLAVLGITPEDLRNALQP